MIDLLGTAVLSLCAAGFIPSPECPYVLKAVVVEAIDGGPVVVHVEVRRVVRRKFGGNLEFATSCPLPSMQPKLLDCEVDAPASWGKPASIGFAMVGPPEALKSEMTPAEIPKDGCHTFLFLHQRFRHSKQEAASSEIPSGAKIWRNWIPNGTYRLLVTWSFRLPGASGFGRAAAILPVRVLPATAENLSNTRQRLEKLWQEAGVVTERQNTVIQMLYQTSQPELVEAALSILRSPNLSPDADADLLVVNAWHSAPELTHATFTRLALDFTSSVAVDVFNAWSIKPSLLPDAELRRLCESTRIWSRILTYAVFDTKCDREWVAKLRQEVPSLCKSAATQKLAQLLRDLDDSRFKVRRHARDELFGLGETAESQVRAALKQPLSAEVRTSLHLFLERMENGESPFRGKRVIELLASATTAKGKEMLELLAQGDPENFVTRQAKLALQNRNQAK